MSEKKRFLVLLLALSMVVGSVPQSAFAEGEVSAYQAVEPENQTGEETVSSEDVEEQTPSTSANVLASPGNPRWDGSNLIWDPVTTMADGTDLYDAKVVYTIEVFKDGAENAIFTINSQNVNSYMHFSNHIHGEQGFGKGTYTFKVKAQVEGRTDIESSESEESESYVVPEVKVVGNIKDVTVTSVSDLLLPGNWEENAGRRENSTQISTSDKRNEGFSFSGWNAYRADSMTGEPVGNPLSDFYFSKKEIESNSELNNDGAQELSPFVTIKDNYDGPDSVVLVASWADQNAPRITKFSSDADQLLGEASDAETGIKAYAFTTSKTAPLSGSPEWKFNDSTSKESQMFTFHPTDGGKYYFHVQDGSGQISTSEEGIKVTRLNYHRTVDAGYGVYKYSTKEDDVVTRYIIGSLGESYKLLESVRAGYNFIGWSTEKESRSGAVTISDHDLSAEGLDLYPAWEPQKLQVVSLSDDYDDVYDGNEHELSVKVTNTGHLSFQWYKQVSSNSLEDGFSITKVSSTESVEKDGTIVSSIKVKNVADSAYYFVEVSLTDDEGEEIFKNAKAGEIRSNRVGIKVNIRQRELYLKPISDATNDEITYGDPAPSYQVTYDLDENKQQNTGFVGTENETSVIKPGSISCVYTQDQESENSNVKEGGYPIVAEKYVDQTGNYHLNILEGRLLVKPVETDLTASFRDPNAKWVYEYDPQAGAGKAHTPGVKVEHSGNELDPQKDYTLEYSNNQNATTESTKASVKITWKGNYKGETTLYFDIYKATPSMSVTMKDWSYGDPASDPILTGIPADVSQEDYKIEYAVINQDGQIGEVLKNRPVNAGFYAVRVVLDGSKTTNYYGCTTDWVPFSILKRKITLEAASETFVYDGAVHTNNGYSYYRTDADQHPEYTSAFPANEGFHSVKVLGSIQDVGIVENKPSYELTKATSGSNYEIEVKPGLLKVTPLQLPVPAKPGWSSSKPGTATWVSISRRGLHPSYELQLYAYDVDTGEYTAVSENSIVTTEDHYDFSETIRAFATDKASV